MGDLVQETFITTEPPADLGFVIVFDVILIVVSLQKFMSVLNHRVCYFCLTPAVFLVLVVHAGGAQLFHALGQLQPGQSSPGG